MDCPVGRKKTGQKEKEFIEMENAIRTLSNEGFLSKIECRIIASRRELDARKVALYNMITSKYKQDPMNVLEILKVLTAEIQEEADANAELSNFDVNEEINVNPLNETGKNPLLINTVIHNVFTFLPLSEIKTCCLVNHQWNTTAEPFLRKRGVIHFKPQTLAPLDFIHAQEFSLPDLPFTNFKFSGNKKWCLSEIEQFFDKWGNNIKSVEFQETFFNNKINNDYRDVSSWITKIKNLNKLIIRCHPQQKFGYFLGIKFDALFAVVESISLANCTIFFSGEGKGRLIAPRKIHLEEVAFQKGGQFINDICFNHYIDFSRCLKIDIRQTLGRRGTTAFDMSSVVLNAKSIYFDGISVENWGGARGKVDSILLSKVRLIERNNLEIKELTLKSGTIDMSIIPQAIEKLRFSDNTEIICDDSLQLPNLTFLGMCQLSQSNLEMISRFACCGNLREVELVGFTLRPPLNVHMGKIPKSVKKLKISNVNPTGLHKRQLDTLIIEQSNFKNFFNA